MGAIVSELYEGTIRIFSKEPFISQEDLEDIVGTNSTRSELFLEAEEKFWKLSSTEESIRHELITETLLESIDRIFSAHIHPGSFGFLSSISDAKEQMGGYTAEVRNLLKPLAEDVEDPLPSVLIRFDFYCFLTARKYYFQCPILTKSLVDSVVSLYGAVESGLSEVSELALRFLPCDHPFLQVFYMLEPLAPPFRAENKQHLTRSLHISPPRYRYRPGTSG